VSPSQINAQVPFETPAGNTMLVVQRDGVSSAPTAVAVTATGPGVLTMAPRNHAVAQNSADWSMNSPQNPFCRGSMLPAI